MREGQRREYARRIFEKLTQEIEEDRTAHQTNEIDDLKKNSCYEITGSITMKWKSQKPQTHIVCQNE